MKNIVQILGSIIFVIGNYLVPIMVTLAFVYKWSGFITWMWFLALLAQAIAAVCIVCDVVDKDGGT